MADIHATMEKWKGDLMSRRGVVGVGETEKGLVVFIKPCIPIEPSIPTCIEGVPVETEITGGFRAIPKKVISV